jgi:hypothetical protein
VIRPPVPPPSPPVVDSPKPPVPGHPLAGERQPMRAVVHAELGPRGIVAVAGGLWPAVWRGPADRVPRRGGEVWVRLEDETSALLVATDGERKG